MIYWFAAPPLNQLFKPTRPSNAWLILLCSAGLLTIWPLPETIALRQALLAVGCIASLFFLRAYAAVIFSRAAWPLWVFLGFYLWLLLHLLFFSTSYDEQLYELQHVWMRCLSTIPLGLSLGMLLAYPQPLDHPNAQPRALALPAGNTSVLLLLIGFSGIALIGCGRYILEAWHTHQMINYEILYSFYKAKQPFVVGAALALPLSFILIIRGINRQMSKWWIVASLLIIIFSLFVTYFSNTKNGIAVFTLSLAVFIFNLVLKLQRRLRSILMAALVSMGIVSVSYVGIEMHLERNKAWGALIANFKIGVDIDYQNYWRNGAAHPVPINQYGEPVDVSTYERTAWFRVGLRLLKENPMGYGLLHHSFGSLALMKYPDFRKPIMSNRGATHSGWMDFALGFGFPGLLLLLVPLFAAWYRSLYQEGLWFSYTSWTIPIMSFAYLTTEVAGMHYTEMLFFMVAFFCGITLQYPKQHHQTHGK